MSLPGSARDLAFRKAVESFPLTKRFTAAQLAERARTYGYDMGNVQAGIMLRSCADVDRVDVKRVPAVYVRVENVRKAEVRVLRACPFCGADGVTSEYRANALFVTCRGCGCRCTFGHGVADKVVSKWNTRAGEAGE